jgi:glycosyltransferase involved in cell wall biosynthesis
MCTILANILPDFPARDPIFVVEAGKNHHNCGLEETNSQRFLEIRMKTLLASEEITNRPREGTLVFLMHLCRFLHREGELTAVYALGDVDPDIRSFKALSPKTLITEALIRLTRSEHFDIVLYVPRSGLSAFNLLRGTVLRFLTRSPTIVIGLQECNASGISRPLFLFGKPDLVLSPVRAVREKLERLGIDTGFVMPGYDDSLFKPVNPEARSRLKRKYDLPLERFVLLHVGHVRQSRNLEVLLRYHDWGPDIQPVVKAGEIDPAWAHRLRMAGIIVIDEYFHDVHELYQASDAYLFPVNRSGGAVEIPLSVIEACACNLPVITTRFGALPETIREGNGFHYYNRVSEIAGKIAEIRQSRTETAAKVKDLSWEKVFRTHLYPRMRSLAEESRDESAP